MELPNTFYKLIMQQFDHVLRKNDQALGGGFPTGINRPVITTTNSL